MDTVSGLMHNKIMILDGLTSSPVASITPGWPSTRTRRTCWIHDPALADEYTQNWNIRAPRSRPLAASAEGAAPSAQAAPEAAAGPITGNRHSMIYEWSGCRYYGKIAPGNRASFQSVQAAEAAGYRPAKNCP